MCLHREFVQPFVSKCPESVLCYAVLPAVVIEVTAEQLLATLENSVSMYPKLEGRFCQVSLATA